MRVYQTEDEVKTQRKLVATAVIDMHRVLGPEKETMFEVEGCYDGKTMILLDRLQEID